MSVTNKTINTSYMYLNCQDKAKQIIWYLLHTTLVHHTGFINKLSGNKYFVNKYFVLYDFTTKLLHT